MSNEKIASGHPLPAILRALPALDQKGLVTIRWDGDGFVNDEYRSGWLYVRETRPFLLELERGWERTFDPVQIEGLAAGWAPDRCHLCAGVGVVQQWVIDYRDTSDYHLPRFAEPGGRVAVRCRGCASSSEGRSVARPTGGGCPVCVGDEILPMWAARAIESPAEPEWTQKNRSLTDCWYPAPCSYCGGWGRLADNSVVHGRGSTISDGPENFFRRNGDVWRICYGGQELPEIMGGRNTGPRKGLEYLALILRPPPRLFSPSDLFDEFHHHLIGQDSESDSDEAPERRTAVEVGPKRHAEPDGRDYREVVDNLSVSTIRAAMKGIDDRLADPGLGNPETRIALKERRALMADRLAKDVGPLGRVRKFANDDTRCRTKVDNAIKRALGRIRKEDHGRGLAEHIKSNIKVLNGYHYNGGLEWDVIIG